MSSSQTSLCTAMPQRGLSAETCHKLSSYTTEMQLDPSKRAERKDVDHFLSIAQDGYNRNPGSNVREVLPLFIGQYVYYNRPPPSDPATGAERRRTPN